MILLLTPSLQAIDATAISPAILKDPNGCLFSGALHYEIVKKAGKEKDKNVYILNGDDVSSVGLLVTKKEFIKPGPIFMYLHYVRTKKMRLENGFESDVDAWTDCTNPAFLK